MYNLKIEDEASLTLPLTTCLTVNGTLTNAANTIVLMFKSEDIDLNADTRNDRSTGSLKVLGSVLGRATVQQWVAPNAWHQTHGTKSHHRLPQSQLLIL
jgi:hypothetical protein